MNRQRTITALLAGLFCFLCWCGYTMPSDADIDRQMYCHDTADESVCGS